MSWAGVFFTLVAGPLVAGSFIIAIFQSYTRETTGIFERWGTQATVEREALTDAAAAIDVNPNSSGRADGLLVGDDNHDGDCLTNAEETALGLDPRNPDTDGDGSDDCTEIDAGTDPLDFRSGGIGTVTPTPPLAERSQLYIDRVIKTVNGQHLIYTSPGSTLDFHIRVNAYMTGAGTKTIVVEDTLNARLQFTGGYIGENDGENNLDTWPGKLEFPVTAGSHQIDIYFSAEVTGNTSQLIGNEAIAYDKDNRLVSARDYVFINIEVAGSDTPPPPIVIDLYKSGRAAETIPWYRYVFSEPNGIVEFRISAEISQNDLTLHDLLPEELDYIPNTLRLLHNNTQLGIPESALLRVFENGLDLNRGAGIYELYFSATVNTDEPFALTNRASILQNNLELESAESIVTNRPQ